MANIDNLTTTEKKDLCNLIGGNNFMRFFKDNPNEYQKIKHGFRVKNLKSEEALALGLRYVGKPVINRFIERLTSCELEEIKKRHEDFLKEENNKGLADFTALKGSLFRQNIPLYFKLSERDESEGYIQLLSYLVENAVKEDKEKEEADSSCNLLTRQVNELKKKLEDSENLYTTEKQNHEKLLAAGKDLQNELEEKIQNAEKAKLEILNDLEKERKLTVSQRKTIESLKKERQNVVEELDQLKDAWGSISTLPYMSLCLVEKSGYLDNKIRLRRQSDIQDGMILDSYSSNIPSSRPYLFGKNLPPVGTIGVWRWNEDENHYVTVQRNLAFQLIQVIMLQAANETSLVEAVKNGVPENFIADDILLVYQSDAERYVGLYCHKSDFVQNGTAYYLRDDVYSLPMYKFSGYPFISVGEYIFYRKPYLGTIESYVQVKSPDEIIKNLLLQRMTWANMKQEGIVRHNFQHIKNLLGKMMIPSFYEEVGEACDCSLVEAKELVADFIDKSNRHISGKDVANSVIADVIESNDDLRKRMNEISYKRWLEENKESITAKNHELEEIDKKLAEKQSEVDELQKNEKNLIAEIDSLEKELSTKQEMSTQLDVEVRKNIQNAEKNVSSFLVDLMMKYGLHTETKALDAKAKTKSLFNPGSKLEKEPDTFIDKTDFLYNLSENLQSAGIAEEYTSKLSYYLYAAYLQRFPIMLAGPNGEAVADAFSCTVNNQLAGKVDFHGDFDSNTFSMIRHSSDKVIAVTNPFNSRWISYLPKLLEDDKFYILITPYPEEMQLEPSSLYNLIFPLSIDEMIDAVPQYDGFMGGSWDKKEGFDEIKPNTSCKRVLELCQIRPLMEKNVGRVIQAWCNLSGEQMISNDDRWRFIIYPYAYATRHMSEAAHYLSDRNIQVSDSISKLFEKANEE